MVMAFWHGDELAILAFNRFYRLTTMSSTSKDGELMNSVLGHMGIMTSRGSSTRGGARALIGIIKWAKEGWTPAIPVDGPKGPIYKVKPGIFDLAKRLDAAIIPAGMWCSHRIEFPKSWNKTYLPMPFSKVHLRWAPPMRVLDVELDSRDQALAERLEAALNSAREVAAQIPNC
ncbi:MAG: lysophospholipid acyltransferase family protein [Bdellovibrionales bacterium]|nr:lysophospholipid acyltransferase family protein [Bdellovibrionales bacterium]